MRQYFVLCSEEFFFERKEEMDWKEIVERMGTGD